MTNWNVRSKRLMGGWLRIIIVGIVIAICAIAAIRIYEIFDLYSTEQLVEGYADNVASAFGISPLLAKAAAFALLLPASMALWLLLSLSKAKRRWGNAILATAAVLYFLALWFGTKDQKVSRRGDPLQCYVVTEQGVAWRDIRYLGTDPQTGRPCEAAKPYLLPKLARLNEILRSGLPLEPVDPKGHFFTPIGDPIIWFYRTKDGELEFYDAPGVRPRGDQLQPITKVIVEEWERRESEKAEAERRRLAVLEKARLDAEAAMKRQQEEDRRAHMRSLVIASTAGDLAQTFGLAITPSRPDSALDRLAAERLPELLTRIAPNSVHVIPAMLTEDFVKEGFFT